MLCVIIRKPSNNEIIDIVGPIQNTNDVKSFIQLDAPQRKPRPTYEIRNLTHPIKVKR